MNKKTVYLLTDQNADGMLFTRGIFETLEDAKKSGEFLLKYYLKYEAFENSLIEGWFINKVDNHDGNGGRIVNVFHILNEDEDIQICIEEMEILHSPLTFPVL